MLPVVTCPKDRVVSEKIRVATANHTHRFVILSPTYRSDCTGRIPDWLATLRQALCLEIRTRKRATERREFPSSRHLRLGGRYSFKFRVGSCPRAQSHRRVTIVTIQCDEKLISPNTPCQAKFFRHCQYEKRTSGRFFYTSFGIKFQVPAQNLSALRPKWAKQPGISATRPSPSQRINASEIARQPLSWC